VLFVYAIGALAAWRENASPASRAIFAVALLFIAFAFYGAGLEADLWSVALLGGGLAIRLTLRLIGGSSRGAVASPGALRE
jgi:APA family basic amino acid/polyamine antiporter